MDVKSQMIKRASLLWDCPEEQVNFENGAVFHVSDPELKFTFKELASLMPETGGPVVGRANLNPGGSGGSYSANIIDVEVDIETGKIDIVKVTAFQDAGTAIHPDYVEGQIQGGTVQGIGWALNEEYFMGSDGAIQNTSLLDYRMPTSLDLPMIDSVVIEVPNPGHPFGVRGVGEANLSAPLGAVANAVYDAIGVRIPNLPMSPATVHSTMNKE
jgi:CO/xanthine dehydrogenase Mo-binding subunit